MRERKRDTKQRGRRGRREGGQKEERKRERGGGKRETESGWERVTGKEAAHFSCLSAERGESPTDFPRGMQIRIEISRENVKDPMRFVRVVARCEFAGARTPLEIIISSFCRHADEEELLREGVRWEFTFYQ